MKSLTIKDLSRTEELDRAAMAAVQGGTYKGMPAYWLPAYGITKNSFSFDAAQAIGQEQNVLNNNGNNVAFAHDIHSTVKPTQSANNNISF